MTDAELVLALRQQAAAHERRARQPENITLAMRLAADRIEALAVSAEGGE